MEGHHSSSFLHLRLPWKYYLMAFILVAICLTILGVRSIIASITITIILLWLSIFHQK